LFFIAGAHEVRLLRWICKLMPRSGVLWDVGANAGTTILWMNREMAGKGPRFVAFEAMPDTAALLRENIALNPDCKCTIIEAAVTDSEGTIEFATSGAGDGAARASNQYVESNLAGRRRVVVNAVKLDKIYATQLGGEDPPDVLLIDVEGAAGGVLRGGANVLRASLPCVVVEIHTATEASECDEALFPLGYKMLADFSWYGSHRVYAAKALPVSADELR
jgi:FkbM family methyltransferase